jgi:hypothetical protein
MDERSYPDTRQVTLGLTRLSLASAGLLLLIWIPVAATAGNGSPPPISPRMIEFMLVLWVIGTVPAFLIGVAQMALWRPRVYGLLSLALSALPLTAIRPASWLLLALRGVRIEFWP